jgi:hypothetical protein
MDIIKKGLKKRKNTSNGASDGSITLEFLKLFLEKNGQSKLVSKD